MVAYVVLVAREVPEDPRVMGPYQDAVEATMARYGGGYRTLLRHRVTVLEGDIGPQRGVVVVEFPSYEQAWAWYHSPEYASLRALRQEHMRCDTILVEGLRAGEPVISSGGWSADELARIAASEARRLRDGSSESP
jgi:uncharacterized protein (DUF1330 family)